MTIGYNNFRTDKGVFSGLDRWDVCLALCLGGVAAVWALFSSAVGLPPEVWEELAAAVGLRPPLSPYPGLWRIGVEGLLKIAGLDHTFALLRCLGSLTVFVFAALSYLTLRDSLEFASAPHIRHPMWRFAIPRGIVALGTLLISTSVPMGRLGRFFGPETFLTALAITALFLMRRFLRSGGTWALYLAMAIVGVTAAETPLGFVLFAFILVKSLMFIWRPYNLDLPICNLALRQSIRWHLTGIFFWFAVLTTAFNVRWFYHHGGFEACGWTTFIDIIFEMLKAYARVVMSYSSLGGWLAGIAVSCVPFILARKLFRSCLDLDTPLPFIPGLTYLVLILVVYSQFVQFPGFWFWTSAKVVSPMLTLLFFYMAVSAFVYSLAVWAINLYCRSERMVWLFSFPEALEDVDANPRYGRFAEFLHVKSRIMRRYLPQTIFAILIIGALPFWRDRQFRAVSELVSDGISLAVDEIKGVRWIFTDGRFDAALELEAARRGERVTALSLLAPRGPRTKILNHRDVADDEDRLILSGAAEALKSWILDKPARLDESAMQLGVEMFAQAKKPDPEYLGFVARTRISPESVQNSHEAAEKLEKRILAFYEEFDSSETYDRLSGELLNALQWRLSRLLRFRAAVARKNGELAEANAIDERADALDDKNADLKSLVRKLDWMAAGKGETLTPREGLRVALSRPDFMLACCYAIPILRSNPDDAEANFAVAMRNLIEKDWAAAESHFRRVLSSRPNEVAVINNLAIVCFHQGKTEEALRLALEAQKLAPSSEAVADTLKTIRRANLGNKGL
ncbi:MAG: tetratricopeptide repeat protein [Kiritimatiellae bacterium]|nr:tetratricopeptide repeat protein [Kiritimatiellia bacterium]